MVNPDANREDLKATLRKQFGSLTDFERQHGLPALSVTAALRRPHALAEGVIAAAIGVPAHLIWPSRYDVDGTRLHPQPVRNYWPARGRAA